LHCKVPQTSVYVYKLAKAVCALSNVRNMCRGVCWIIRGLKSSSANIRRFSDNHTDV